MFSFGVCSGVCCLCLGFVFDVCLFLFVFVVFGLEGLLCSPSSLLVRVVDQVVHFEQKKFTFWKMWDIPQLTQSTSTTNDTSSKRTHSNIVQSFVFGVVVTVRSLPFILIRDMTTKV